MSFGPGTERAPEESPQPERSSSWAGVPPRLLVLPREALPAPPVVARPPLLPVHELGWEDFERLCLRLLERDVEPVHVYEHQAGPAARRYGTSGQAQAGIDVYARAAIDLGDPETRIRYTCLQSRRIARVTRAGIKSSVADFLAGKWSAVSDRFVYATSAPCQSTPLQDEVEAQTRRLHKKGIAFEVWDSEEFSRRLKDLPHLVDDFFDRPWVERFCSADAAAGLGTRLDGTRSRQLRIQLAAVYRAAFAVADSGVLALQTPRRSVGGLRERFVTPDLVRTTQPGAVDAARTATDGAAPVVPSDPAELLAEANPHVRRAGDRARRSPTTSAGPGRRPGTALESEERMPASAWLGTDPRQVVVGDAGAGKSTLLRYLLLDLLSDEPDWQHVAGRWGQRLPVWLPFHFFTQVVAGRTGASASVGGALEAWLEQHDLPEAWPLVQDALSDRRLLLVVDGLDEWVDDDAGRYAASALERFTEQFGCAVVVSTRPYGLSKLTLGTDWTFAHVAALSSDQQRALASPYFRDGTEGEHEAGDHVATHAVDTFLAEIWGSPDLQALAAVPLFLLLLVGLRLSSVSKLPDRRFEVADRAVQLLLSEHPAQRRSAAAVTASKASPGHRQTRAGFGHVAFLAQQRGDLAAIDSRQLRKDLIAALEDPETLALAAPDAARTADELLDVAEGELGLLVRKGPGALGFLHRLLQEQLAAEHVSERLSPDEQEQLITSHVGNPRWRDVVLGLLWLTRRPSELRTLVAAVGAQVADTRHGLVAREVLAEVVFGDFRLPGGEARLLAEQMLTVVRSHSYSEHRIRLLTAATAGLHSAAVSAEVERAMQGRVVATERPTLGLLMATADLAENHTDDDRVRRALITALGVGDVVTSYAAALAIVHRASSVALDAPRRNLLLGDLLHILRDPLSGTQQAAALVALSLGWPEDPGAVVVLEAARSTSDDGVRLVGLAHALGVAADGVAGAEPAAPTTAPVELDPAERRWLLEALDSRGPYGEHAGLLLATLVRVVDGDRAVLDKCLTTIAQERGQAAELGWTVAMHAFADEVEVVAAISERIRTDEHLWPLMSGSRGAMRALKRAYGPGTPGNRQVAAAIEERLDTFGSEHRPVELFHLAAVDQGPRMRAALLRDLTDDSWPHWAAAALANHFADDESVTEQLRTVLMGDATRASMIANVARQVLGDAEAFSRMRAVVAEISTAVGRGRARPDIAVPALLDVWTARPELMPRDELAEQTIPLVVDRSHPLLGDPTYELAEVLYPAPSAVAALDRLGLTDDRPLSTFLRIHRDDGDRLSPFLHDAERVIGQLSPTDRACVCDVLAGGSHDPALVRRLTRRWADEVDDFNKSAASLAFHTALLAARRAGLLDDAEWSQARAELGTQASAYGPDHQARRRAAWVGMCVLEDWSVLDERVETIGKPVGVGVDLSDPLSGPDLVLLSQLAEKWTELRAHFGSDLVRRISGMRAGVSDHSAWTSLALVANSHPILYAELEAAVDDDPRLLHQDEVLIWFVRRHTSRPDALLDQLLTRVQADSNLRGVATYLLSRPESLGIEPAALRIRLEPLVRDFGGPWGDAALEVLAYVDPGHALVARRWLHYRAYVRDEASAIGNRHSAHPQTYLAVAYASVSVDEFLWQLARDLRWLDDIDNDLFGSACSRHVTRRLSRDPDVAALVKATVLDAEVGDGPASHLLVLLAKSVGLDGELLHEVDRRLASSAQISLAPIIRDPVRGDRVSVRTALLRATDHSAAPGG